jgi:hypothetical protein
MPRKSPPPVSSFGPELLAALLRGGESRLEIKLSSFDLAFSLRQRFYALRKSMRNETHPQTSLAYRCSIALPSKEQDGTSILTLRPRDDEFASALRDAGISAPKLDGNPLNEIEESSLSESALQNLLRDL